MFQIILVSGAIFILFLTSCTVNILAPDGYEMEDYPSTWEPLAVVKKNKDCVDISGRYYSSYGLLEIIEKIDNDSIVLSSNPNIIEFTIKSEKSLEIKGFRGSDLLFRKETKFACNAGFVSITLHTEFAGGLFIGYGTERVHFGTTRARQLVAELSTQAIALIGLVLPVVGGGSHWLKFQPVETAYVTDAETMYVLGRESSPQSKQQFIWFCRAAHEGHHIARFLLASRFYEQIEMETPSTRERAYLWYSLAANSGEDDAILRLEKLKGKMTPVEIYDSDRLVTRWVSEPSACTDEAKRLQLD